MYFPFLTPCLSHAHVVLTAGKPREKTTRRGVGRVSHTKICRRTGGLKPPRPPRDIVNIPQKLI